jgi:predicted acylesterase/phospholipase RssA
MYDQVRIIYGPTGGRFTFLSGVIDAFETRLTEAGIRILDRVGISGGALSAAIRASGESFPSWLARASAYKENIKIGGSFTKQALSVWQLITTGGMIRSKTVLDTMFRPTAPLPPIDGDCWAVSWCKSSKRGVAFRLGIDMDMGLCLLASCAMPVAFSPVKIQNKDLPWRIRLELGVSDPYAYSTFRDGGLSPEFPGNLTGTNDYAPTIIINLDGKTPEDGPLFTRLCYGVIKSKTLDGVEEASRTRPIEMINIPVPPKVDEFAARFDISEEEGMWQYRLGLKSGEIAVEEFLQRVDAQQHSQSQPVTQESTSQPGSSQQHPSSCTEPHLSSIP